MKVQQIRDQKGRLVGTISNGPNKQQNARDARERFLGSNDPHIPSELRPLGLIRLHSSVHRNRARLRF